MTEKSTVEELKDIEKSLKEKKKPKKDLDTEFKKDSSRISKAP